MTFKKILIPIDGSSNSEAVLEPASGLAERLDAAVVLLAVIEPDAWFDDDSDGDSAESQQQAAEKYLEEQAAGLRERGLDVTSVTESGSPADTVLAVAKSSGVDMIAMATHRESALARGILGSVTDAVLRSSEVPVLAFNPDGDGTDGEGSRSISAWAPSTVIVPLDGSDLATESVPIALEIAKACEAKVIFIQAVHLPSFAVSGPGAEHYDTGYGASGRQDRVRDYLQQFVETAEKMGVSATAHAALGNVAARIVEESNSVPDAMVIISSHGRGGFRRMVLGSVADKIVRASHHPVLVLKHGTGG